MDTNCSRRTFIGGVAATGAMLGAGLFGCAPAQPGDSAADSRGQSSVFDGPVQVDEAKITDTLETEVVVVGLGVAGVAALRSAAESGVKAIGIEKCAVPSARSSMFAAFNTDHARKLGITDIDTNELTNELMRQMCHRADYRIIKRWTDHCGEAFDWYAGAYDGLVWVGPDDEYPADEKQVFVANFEHYPPQAEYQYGRDHEHDFFGCLSFGPDTHMPILEANVRKATGFGAEVYYNCAAQILDVSQGKVTGVVCKNLQDDTYTRIKASKGVILATGDYSHQDEMLERFAPWIYAHKERYCFSYPHIDLDGKFADTGDGHIMGLGAGGHLDIGPHAVMAHTCLGVLGVDAFLQLNEKGERYANEDLNTTHLSAILERQPGTKVYQIVDGNWEQELPYMQPGLGNALNPARVGTPDTWASASGKTIDDLIVALGVDGNVARTMKSEIQRYNELCRKGVDEDFGKTPSRMFALETPPFYAVISDTATAGTADDITKLRLLVTLSGLVTDKNAEVIDEAGNPIEGLYAIGNVQGGRFADDYPTTLSGASHACALTYGYLVGRHIAGASI